MKVQVELKFLVEGPDCAKVSCGFLDHIRNSTVFKQMAAPGCDSVELIAFECFACEDEEEGDIEEAQVQRTSYAKE